jgi:predicted amidophosphoribosyltransferase
MKSRRRLGHMLCGAVWSPRTKRPSICPKCKRHLNYTEDLASGKLKEWYDPV